MENATSFHYSHQVPSIVTLVVMSYLVSLFLIALTTSLVVPVFIPLTILCSPLLNFIFIFHIVTSVGLQNVFIADFLSLYFNNSQLLPKLLANRFILISVFN